METTIKITKKTLEKLKSIKVHPRQSYEEIIVALIKIKKGSKNV